MGKTQNLCRGGRTYTPPQFPLDELPEAMRLLAEAISQQSAREAKKKAPAEDTGLPGLLTAGEVASILHIRRDHVYRLAHGGKLNCIHIGRKVRFKVLELKNWIKSLEIEEKDDIGRGL